MIIVPLCLARGILLIRELFEGLLDILPDADKKREMLVLLAASRSAQATISASRSPPMRKKASPSGAASPSPPDSSETREAQGRGTQGISNGVAKREQPRGAAGSKAPSAPSGPSNEWPEIGGTLGAGAKQSAAGGKAKGLAGSNGGGAKRTPTMSSPGTTSSLLKSMNRAGNGKTGIAVVRSKGSSSQTPAAPRARSESPPPGVPLRRKDDHSNGLAGRGIGEAGASWATQGGSGYRGSRGAEGAGRGPSGQGTKISSQDFPGLPETRIPSQAATSGNPAGRSARSDVFTSPLSASRVPVPPPPPQPPASSSREHFPGLPTPSQAMPGMERVDWGTSHSMASSGSVEWGAGGIASRGGGDEGSGTGKNAKKRNKQKAQKDALKGMAFGFR